MAPKKKPDQKVAAENRKARHNYSIEDVVETGIVLQGTEVKALRAGQGQIAESYASVENGELWLINSYIPEYLQANRFNHEERRRRKLLVKRKELDKLAAAVSREGMTLVPLKLFFNDRGMVKLELGLAKGKKAHDKRESAKERDWNRDKQRLLKRSLE